jgi:4-amino-4-deoxy-L-arabinose transferase-like glycosyltransferase
MENTTISGNMQLYSYPQDEINMANQTDPLPEPKLKSRLFGWQDGLLALLVGTGSFLLYQRTLYPGALPGDSGEFQVLAHQLGIAHCPGYPVYLLLAWLFQLLPIGEVAYRVNLFSAFMAALTVSGVYLAAWLLSQNRLAALFGALALAVSASFWSQAVVAEVYTAGAAFIPPIIIGLLAWQRSGKSGWLILAGLCGGLSLGVNGTVALLAPAAVIFLWLNRKERPGLWKPAILGATLGTLLFLGIFALIDLNSSPANIFNAAYESARSAWNMSKEDVANPIQRIIFIGTAVQWRSAMFNIDTLPGHLYEYITEMDRQFYWLSLLFMLAGLVWLFKSDRSRGWLFLSALIAQWIYSLTYAIWDIYVFHIAGYVLMAMLASYGAARLSSMLARLPLPGARYLPNLTLVIILVICVWPVLRPNLPAVKAGQVPFFDNDRYIARSDSETLNKVAANVVDQLPQDAIVFLDWNSLYPYYYAAHIKKDRTDLRFIEPAPRADQPGLPASVIEFIADNIDERPIFFAQPFREVENAGYRLLPRDVWFMRFYKVEER